IKQLFHIRCKVSQNKTEQIKRNGINKNSILPPNNVAPQKQLWLFIKNFFWSFNQYTLPENNNVFYKKNNNSIVSLNSVNNCSKHK
uniref:Uncharacterized protein n=1 Tax=Sinocyclocheilus grahami TaxID=75366 RepID=A0A672MTI3_SINGR